MAKKDLIKDARSKGIKLTGRESIPQLEKLLAEFVPEEGTLEKDETVSEPEIVVPEVTEDIADVIREQVADIQRRHDEWLKTL